MGGVRATRRIRRSGFSSLIANLTQIQPRAPFPYLKQLIGHSISLPHAPLRIRDTCRASVETALENGPPRRRARQRCRLQTLLTTRPSAPRQSAALCDGGLTSGTVTEQNNERYGKRDHTYTHAHPPGPVTCTLPFPQATLPVPYMPSAVNTRTRMAAIRTAIPTATALPSTHAL